MLHKQYGKKYLIICYYTQYRSVSTIFWKFHLVNSKDALILAYCLPFGKAGGLQILRCQGIEVNKTTTSPLTPPLCGMKHLILLYKGAPLDSEALRLLQR
jgi:hypothetical protein